MRALAIFVGLLIAPGLAAAQWESFGNSNLVPGAKPPASTAGLAISTYANQACSGDNPSVNSGTIYPNSPCPNPNGLIMIDPTRYGFAANLGGRPDANGSMYGIDTGGAPCTGAGAALGCADAVTDFVSFASETNAAMTLTFANAVTATKNAQTIAFNNTGQTGDKFFCRDTTTPFARADAAGACAGGTCAHAAPNNHGDAFVVQHNVAAAVCTALDVPLSGCTGSGTGTVWRYYPIIVSSSNICSANNNTLTTFTGNPETFLVGDSLQPYTVDGTHQSAYGHAYLAQLIEEATWEQMYVPRVNMIPGGSAENSTANNTTANCVNADATAGFSFTGGTWLSNTGTLDPTGIMSNRTAVYGRSCWGSNAVANNAYYAKSPTITVTPNMVYTIVGLVQVPTGLAQIQIADQGGTVIDPTSAFTVAKAWSPRGGADYDPLTYNATGLNGTPSLDFPAAQSTVWAPVVMKVRVPAGVTGLEIRVGRNTTASNLMLDEWWMYPSLHQNVAMNRIFPNGLHAWNLTGDSRATTATYGIDNAHAGVLGMLDYAHEQGYSNRPLITWPTKLFPVRVDAVGGRRLLDELNDATPFSIVKAQRPRFGFIQLGLNDINSASVTPAVVSQRIIQAREKIASYGAIPVWIAESPWKGSVGTAAGAQTCSVATTTPDFSGRTDNCGAAILSINRRVLHEAIAW
jgi:hypothetical protein